VEQIGKADGKTLARAMEQGLLDPALDAANDGPKVPPKRQTEWTVFVPLMVAVVGSVFAAGVSILTSSRDAETTLAAEREKLRSSIILQAIRTDDATQPIGAE
jgi:hypothetical protein